MSYYTALRFLIKNIQLPVPRFPRALARAYGLYGEIVEKTADFAAAFERAWNSKSACIMMIMHRRISMRITAVKAQSLR